MVNLVELLRNILKNMSTPNTIFPIGTVLAFANDTDPNNVYTSQTWEPFAKGKTLVGVDESDSTFSAVGKTGGEKTHTLTVQEMPAHGHSVKGGAANGSSPGLQSYAKYFSSYRTISDAVYSTGGSGAHNNLQPFETVFYWKRTA